MAKGCADLALLVDVFWRSRPDGDEMRIYGILMIGVHQVFDRHLLKDSFGRPPEIVFLTGLG